MIITNKYKPSIAALKKLPPVMRLKTFETLLSNDSLAYNIFSNFKNEDDFKLMLFSSVLRHRDRAETVWEKYQEVSMLGKKGTIKSKFNCSNCGDYEINITSTRGRTKAGLDKMLFSRTAGMNSDICKLCGKYNQKNIGVECN